MNVKRRDFLGFFLIGGIVSFLAKKLGSKQDEGPKEAMFWRKKTG